MRSPWPGKDSPDDQRSALEALLAAGGRAPRRVLARRWGDVRPMGPGRLERERPWLEPGSPIEGLYYSGFIFNAFASHEQGGHEELIVPHELLVHLPAQPTSAPALAIQAVPQPAVILASGDDLLDDACTLLSYIQNHRLNPAADGSWPARHEAQLLAQLRSRDGTRLMLLHRTLTALGWVRVADAGRLRLDPEPVIAWLQSGRGKQRYALATAWAEDPLWNDLRHVPGLAADDTLSWSNDPLMARRAVLGHLSDCATETWYAAADFVAGLKEMDPDFQRPGGDYSSWYIRDAYSGEYLSGFECWDRVEGALIRFLIAGPLHWLCLVDLGTQSPSAGPISFRLTAAGAAFISRASPPADHTPPYPAVRAGLTIEIPAGRRYERFQLSRVADWVRTGEPYTYRISASSLERARRQGIPVTRVLEFLVQATGKPLPHSVGLAIANWEAQGSQARLEHTLVLRLTNEQLMARVLSAPATRDLIQERIGPAAALVRRKDRNRIIAALAELGILPDVVGIDEECAGS